MSNLFLIPEHDAFPRERKRAIRTFCRCYFSIFLFLVFISVAAIGLKHSVIWLFGYEVARDIVSSYYFIYAAQILVFYILGFPLFYVLNLGLARDVRERRPMSFGQLLIWFLISTFVIQAGAYISALISDIIYLLIPMQSSAGNLVSNFISGVPLWLVFLVVVIIGPIFEELMFRRILIDRLSIYGNRLAIFVSAISFGLFHGNIEQCIYAAGFGIVLGAVYSKTRMLRYTIVLHMLTNFLGTFPSLCIQYCGAALENLNEGDPSYFALAAIYTIIPLVISLIQTGLVISGLVMFIISLVKKRFMPERTCMIKISGFTLTRSVILNFGAIVFLGYSLFEIVSALPILW